MFAFAASAFVPISSASKVSELTFRSGAVILGKEAIGEAAGWAGSEVTGLFTDNEQAKMLAGMFSSMAAGGVSNKVDKHFNLSENFPKSNMELKTNSVNSYKETLFSEREIEISKHIEEYLVDLKNKDDFIIGKSSK